MELCTYMLCMQCVYTYYNMYYLCTRIITLYVIFRSIYTYTTYIRTTIYIHSYMCMHKYKIFKRD